MMAKVVKWALSFTIALCAFSVVLVSGIYYQIDLPTVIMRSILSLIIGLLLGFLVFSELGIFILLKGRKPTNASESNEGKAER